MKIYEPVNRLFEGAVKQDLLKPMPLPLMGELIFSGVASLTKYCIGGGGDERALEVGIDAIWDMISA